MTSLAPVELADTRTFAERYEPNRSARRVRRRPGRRPVDRAANARKTPRRPRVSAYRATLRSFIGGAVRNRWTLRPGEFAFWLDPFTARTVAKFSDGAELFPERRPERSELAARVAVLVELADQAARVAMVEPEPVAAELADRRESRVSAAPTRGPDRDRREAANCRFIPARSCAAVIGGIPMT